MARPSKLTAEAAEEICNAIRAGVPKKYACAAGGIAYSTLASWIERGRDALAIAEEHGKPVHPADQPYVEFLEASTLAEAQGIAALIVLVRGHAVTDWRAALELLKIKAPHEFAVSRRIDMGDRVPAAPCVDIGERLATNPAARRAALAFARAIAEESADS